MDMVMCREARLEELDEIAQLDVEIKKKTYRELFCPEYISRLNKESSREYWKSEFRKNNTVVLVCVYKQEIVGVASVKYSDTGSNRGRLENLYIKEEYQGKGIGKKLFYYAKDLLEKEGFSEMEVYCVEGNKEAEVFYEKLGGIYSGYKIACYTGESTISNRYVYSDLTCKDNLANEVEVINNIVKNEYVLFGLGDCCNAFFEKFRGRNKPKYIFDNYSYEKIRSVGGVPVVQPFKVEWPVIITCLYEEEIAKQLSELGINEIVAYKPWHFKL